MNGIKKLAMITAAIFVGLPAVHSSAQSPLTNPMKSHDVKYIVDSGQIYHDGAEREIVWSDEVTVKGAYWLRLNFSRLVLAGSPLGGKSSTLKITSLSDGSFQMLDARTAVQWRNTSAYFNGGSVRLELIAEPNNRMNQIVVAQVTAGEFDGVDVTGTICDSDDDRQLSDDPRIGRTAPGGCTGWLFNDRNNCMLTAGHCESSNDVMLFNVPLSDAAGNRQFPGPEDQYAVDFSSVQFVNGGIGNDWCYFGCFPNSTTGLTAFEAQGDSLELAQPQAVQAGDLIRITGYGSTSFPVSNTWNGVQKTHLGPYAQFTNDELGYRTDTTGGNSGSPVILESTGQAIGIHTHGGCGSGGGGWNLGTGFLQDGVSNALENPQGICLLTVEINYPNGRPELISPDGTTSFEVLFDDSDFDLDPQSATLHVDSGNGYQEFALEVLGNGLFEATFTVNECGTVVDYFVSIESTTGDLFTGPANAPNQSFKALVADASETVIDDNFQTDTGWAVSGNATTGQWQRGVPNGGGQRGDPPADADGSGACYVTQNGPGDTDVDDGTTTLTSPLIDATTGENQAAILSYFRWHDNGGEGDSLVVEISNNGGGSWVVVENINSGSEAAGGWNLVQINVAEIVEPTAQMRIRFTTGDLNEPSLVESGIDGVKIQVVECDDPFLLGDVNMDGVVDLLDVQPFVLLISSGEYLPEADINGDGAVDLLDVSLFVDLVAG